MHQPPPLISSTLACLVPAIGTEPVLSFDHTGSKAPNVRKEMAMYPMVPPIGQSVTSGVVFMPLPVWFWGIVLGLLLVFVLRLGLAAIRAHATRPPRWRPATTFSPVGQRPSIFRVQGRPPTRGDLACRLAR